MYIINYNHILDQVVQSDDQIYFENDVRIDLRVIGTRTAEGRKSKHSNEVCINNLIALTRLIQNELKASYA